MEKLPVGGFGFELEKSPPAFTPPLFDVGVGSTDEEVMLFLRGRKAGDPIPANVITEVNPFSLEPWDSPDILDEDKHSSFCSYDDIDDDVDHLEGMLMKFLEDEEKGSSTNTPNKSQPLTGSEQVVQAVAGSERLAPLVERRPTLTNTSFYNSNSSSPSDSHSYLELNDLHDPDSASSCSDNSSIMSGDSDDYFDSDELLSYLRGTSSHNIQEQQNNFKFCASASVINPAQPADNIHPKRTHSRSSDSSSSSYGSGSKSLGRIVKFGKKYCCLRTL